MPEPAYMKIVGKTQDDISEGANTAESMGNDYQEEFEDEIIVQAFEHTIHRPTNPQTGQPSGPAVHSPITITKIFDKSSPQLYLAMVTGERLEECEIRFFRTTDEGEKEHYFTISLEDATIVDIKAVMPNAQDPKNASFTHMEEVSFSYNKIVWTHEVASTEGDFSWKEIAAG